MLTIEVLLFAKAVKNNILCAQYRETHEETIALQRHQFYLDNREEILEERAGYYAANAERVKQTVTAYRNANPEKIKALADARYARDPEEPTRWRKANPDRVSVIDKRHSSKRRTLGFNPLNSPFRGCDAHHINQNDVIYIPRKLHHSVWHCIWTGEGMEKINALAGAYLTEDWT